MPLVEVRVMSGAGGGGGGGAPPTGLRPPSKLRRPTTLTSGPGPAPLGSSARPSPLGSGGSGARTPLSAASSLSALNDKSGEPRAPSLLGGFKACA
ncbi:hypothetical protein HPB47_008100 [Ixodes persulcatus]|uniref:Uncharacterized protein n=1 Tax=Ixodes persulcatus TaxID=34615 RepID=A0AC60P5K2_IXOPE|nr:hypothetical protein HPB47_008100 [Ixodes persulcatus]